MEKVTIFLSPADYARADAVREVAHRFELYDPAFSGAEIAIEEGDYTCVAGADAIAGAMLFSAVVDAIDVDEDEDGEIGGAS